MHLTCPLVLASASPRRYRLLSRLGLKPVVVPSGIDESSIESNPERLVVGLAMRKARSVARMHRSAVTLGADTAVVIEGEILGKPQSPVEAAAMLKRLSGRTHSVFTGLALAEDRTGRWISGVEETRVTFAKLRDHEIESYVATGSPLDKAGAYGIQDDLGALLVSRIDGDFYNVVGLPLRRFYEMLDIVFPDRVRWTLGRGVNATYQEPVEAEVPGD